MNAFDGTGINMSNATLNMISWQGPFAFQIRGSELA